MTTKTGKRHGHRSPPRTRKRKLSISIIGAGRLGLAVGIALRKAGHRIELAVTRTSASAKRAARLLRARGIAPGSKELAELPRRYLSLVRQSDLILVATPDDAIPHVAAQLAGLFDSLPAGKRSLRQRPLAVMHTSGALTSAALNSVRSRGVPVGSIHPLISISDHRHAAQSFARVYFSLEGDAGAIHLGKQLVRSLGGRSFVLKTKSKPLYHAAALMASPNLTALMDLAIAMMKHSGVPSAQARRILLPLIGSTLVNLSHHEPARALTGTFKRGDLATVKMHLDAIASQRLTDALRAYIVLGERSLKLSGISQKQKAAIQSLLTQAARSHGRG